MKRNNQRGRTSSAREQTDEQSIVSARTMIKSTAMSAELPFEGARILILTGRFAGQEGACLGFTADRKQWAISPDSSDEIVPMNYEVDFALLIDLSAQPKRN